MGRPPSGGGPVFRFLPTEVADMEKALEDTKGATPVREVMEALANTFSASPGRAGRVSISSKQVWNWFQNRRHQVKKGAKQSEKQNTTATNADTPVSKRTLSTSTAIPSGTNITEPIKMEFEAKSSRDKAWYDVQSFLAHRMLDSGDPEVKVRFAGFGEEDDEWVNVRSGVRQRSVPCETIECVAVLPGDLILCFQEGNEQALYFDAYIKDVERRRHDVRGCRCRFLVQYVHDGIKEIVPLRKVCRRPETEYRLQAKQPKVTGNTPVESKDTIYSMDGNVSTQGNILRVELGDPASGIPRPSATEFNFRLDVGDGVHKEEPKKASLVEMQSPRPGQSSQIVELN